MSSPPTVPKPASAGTGVTAIANTRAAYANIRTGPSTAYKDIGDIRDNSLVVYYPATRTSDNWFWVEQRGVTGWVAGSVVTFEVAIGNIDNEQNPTPYDGAVAVWHWKGDSVPENTIEEFVANLKRRAPHVKQVWVKTSDGVFWQGRFDSSEMAVNGPADIDRWVRVCEQNDLEFHAWCVPQGLDIENETNIIIQTCQRAVVQSMILDVEPYAGFWQGGREAVRPFMLRLRRALGTRFHIAMSMDPRPWHYSSIYPEEWFPFVNSLHPQCYWYTFRNTPDETLQQMMATWSSYGRPIIPALQGDAPVVDQQAAQTLSTQKYGFTGVSWWRYGVISQWDAINQPIELDTSPADPPTDPTDNFTDEVIITPDSPDFRSGTYTGQNEFQSFDGTWNWRVLYKGTVASTSTVWAEWKTQLPESGRYEISTFVPARHATTKRARFKIHGIKGTNTEVVVDIDQSRNRNLWVSLGIFDLVKEQANAGKVFLNDVTGEADKEIAFDAVRFRRIVTATPPSTPDNDTSEPTNPTLPPPGSDRPTIVNGVYVADGYDSPIGTSSDRQGSRVWPSGWLDASPFGRLYFIGTPSEAYHTGADLNFGKPYEDKGMPVYACASGVVTFAGTLRIWGYVIVIRHDPLYVPGGEVLYSRYGHVQNLRVSAGQRVTRGQQIAEIGDAFGRFIPHLHFDLSPTTVLETRPSDWPGTNQASLLRNYIDPRSFITRNRP
jgi:murein DD-endopeptidase MepM/ murein hydrolase activator NlpD/uncharacterized protein YraI